LDEEGDTLQPNWKRTVGLGVQPVELAMFDDVQSSSKHVFAACDRPAIVYVAQNDKLLISNVNVSMEITRTCPFDSEQFPACLALASEEKLVIGTVNDVQKVHVRTIPLHEQPRRIAHQPFSNTFAVCTMKMEDSPEASDAPATNGDGIGPGVDSPEFPEASFVRLLDDRTFELLDSLRLDELEQAISVISMSFNPDLDEDGAGDMEVEHAKTYYVVGTAYVDEEPDPIRGRILVLEVIKLEGDERKLNLVAEKLTRGAVYDLCAFQGKVLASVNSKVHMYRWNDRTFGASSNQGAATTTTTTTSTPTAGVSSTDLLSQEAGYHGHTLSLYIRAEGKSIIVGDLVKSLTLLEWDSERSALEDMARDHNISWVTAIAALDETTFITSDIHNNMVILRPDPTKKTSKPPSTDEYGKLIVDGAFHWGSFVNVFTKGSLVMRTKQDEDDPQASAGGLTVKAQPKLVFGTAGGGIGVLATLNQKEFTLLNRLQVALNEVVPSTGAQKFMAWRAFRDNMRTLPSSGFIDGDLIEMLLEMNNSDVDKVAELMNRGLSDKSGTVVTEEPPMVTSAELVTLVEELTRLH